MRQIDHFIVGGSGGAAARKGDVFDPNNGGVQARVALGDQAVVCSKEALAWTLREIGWPQIGNLIGLAAGLALPSVILMMMFGQTRIFFVMSRDGLLPEAFSKIHPKYNTPHVITVITGVAVALFALMVLTAIHVTSAVARGGKLRYFLWPFNFVWLVRRLFQVQVMH